MQITQNFGKTLHLAMGSDSEKIEKVKQDWFTKEMIDNFFKQADFHMQKD